MCGIVLPCRLISTCGSDANSDRDKLRSTLDSGSPATRLRCGQRVVFLNKNTDKHTDEHTGNHTDKHTGNHTDKQTGNHTDKQTDKPT